MRIFTFPGLAAVTLMSSIAASAHGNTAVVTGVDHRGGTAFGGYGEMYLRFTDVLVKTDGRWQLVVQQTTSTSGF
ncbi:nuclear transport factor 2 family protein [Sphingomonas prati]|uniref:Ketosteroid isomerase-like protein n=1 Tax=Sphingomonas prati TaxID=1843237 RepID=A0A7W9F4C5_9SPHN|nr:nuclear transport factor 2 family protein [Sphingomonas prati]MBB5730774.1 ketosteroid isomerase-like protein [Sphingomonas prati]GGE96667.1 hypothetical protein GCM10011404_32250 [Sphingomonas prati]